MDEADMPNTFGYDRLAEQVASLVVTRVRGRAKDDYLNVGTTEIEKLLFDALEAFCEFHFGDRVAVVPYRRPGDFAADAEKEPFVDICVEQQVELGSWRADFVIHQYDWTCQKWRHVIVECDGHDFHERTKEQAARDRSRDRRASIGGLTVLRFTGSEIWNDPLGCADQVMYWFTAESIREKPPHAA